MGAVPEHDFRADAYYRISLAGFCLRNNSVQSLMACGVKNVAIFLDFTARHGFETAHYATAHAHHIRDIAEGVLDRLITSVRMAVKFLGITSAGEKIAGVGIIEAFSMQTGANEKKFGIAGKILKLACNACHAGSAVLLCFCNHAIKGFDAAFLNGLRDLRDFATRHSFFNDTATTEK